MRRLSIWLTGAGAVALCVAVAVALAATPPAGAVTNEEVARAIQRGLAYIRQQQLPAETDPRPQGLPLILLDLADLRAVESCAIAAARCQACREFNWFDALRLDCDLADDRSANGSCP